MKDLTTIGEVDVTFPIEIVNKTICHPSFGQGNNNSTLKGVAVTFYTELGDLPLMIVKDGNGNNIQVRQSWVGG